MSSKILLRGTNPEATALLHRNLNINELDASALAGVVIQHQVHQASPGKLNSFPPPTCSAISTPAPAPQVPNVYKYFKVSAQITNSKSFLAWRAKIFALADECNGFYCSGGEPESIYYNDDTLVLAILFPSTQDARNFRRELQRRAFIFHIVSSVTVSESHEEVILEAEAKEIHAVHYLHGDSGSPQHSLSISDYRSQDAEESVISVVDADDAYRTLQMIEDPQHPFFYGREFYKCHLASRANHKKHKNNPNNLLILSGLTHQSFDGLNLVTKQHMVPSIAIEFVEFNGTETLEFANGYPFEKDKVTIRIQSPDPKVLEGLGMLLKPGSRVEEGNLLTFVHVDRWQEFKEFLTIKYEETKSLWDKQSTVAPEEIAVDEHQRYTCEDTVRGISKLM